MDKDFPATKAATPHFAHLHLLPSGTKTYELPQVQSVNFGKLLPIPICLDYVRLGLLAAFRVRLSSRITHLSSDTCLAQQTLLKGSYH